MADLIRKVDYFVLAVADKPGEAAGILRALDIEGVNLLAFTGFPEGRRAQLDFVPEDSALFKRTAKRIGLAVKPRKTGFLVQGKDRPGAVAELLEKLAMASINVTAIDAVASGGGRYGAILWVPPRDVNRAARALGAT
jgi:hypothetical protein